MNDFIARTTKALGSDILRQLRDNRFCVVGCGGTGGNFAEMLVRTGATKIDLVDGSDVKYSDLNRVFAYSASDCGAKKTNALAKRLNDIRPGLDIRQFQTHFRTPEQSVDDSQHDPDVWHAVATADVVFIAVDQRDSRRDLERFCRAWGTGRYLSCGIRVDPGNDDLCFECQWRTETPPNGAEHGYGPENASFGSIVVEATSIAFTMLLAHLHDPDSDFVSYSKRYNGAFRLIQ